MRFVEQDAMRESRSAPEDVQRRQYRSDVTEFFIVREARQVNDHAAVRVAESAQQLARRGRSVFASEDAHSGQAFERAVVSFGIDGAHAVAVQNQLFAQKTRDPGFSGFGVARHQHVAAANRERELSTVLEIPEQQTSAAA
jgi:hypothetical protein